MVEFAGLGTATAAAAATTAAATAAITATTAATATAVAATTNFLCHYGAEVVRNSQVPWWFLKNLR